MIKITDIDPTIVPNTSDDLTSKIKNALSSAIDRNEVIAFQSGIYKITGTILDLIDDQNINIVGEGLNNTTIQLIQDSQNPIVRLRGQADYESPFEKQSQFSSFRDITFSSLNKLADCFRFEFCNHIYFNDVMIRGFNGHAVSGYQWWDSNFDRCHFVGCGKSGEKPVVLLDGPISKENVSCNNNTFNTCRFEANNNTCIYMGARTVQNRFFSCKIDRVNKGDAIVFNGAQSNQIIGGIIIGVMDGSAIKAIGSDGLNISHLNIDNVSKYAFDIEKTVNSLYIHNTIGLRKKPLLGNFKIDANSSLSSILSNIGK